MFTNNRSVRAMAGLFALMIFAATLAAQQVGTIQGQVTDDTGAVIPGATVTLVNTQNKEKKTSSDENGNFSFAGLPAGQYAIRIWLDPQQMLQLGIPELSLRWSGLRMLPGSPASE